MKETDLYPPLKRFLEAQGYAVKGEVTGCDLVAVRGEELPVVVELKRTFSLPLLLQAVDRLALTDTVYVAVPEGSPALRRHHKRALKLLRMLGVGLLTVAPDAGRVGVLLDPGPYSGPRVSKKRRERLLGEFHRRRGDPEAGGADRSRGLLTAYRQRALAIGRHLAAHGPCKASSVAAAVGDPKARDILHRNVYGWFERVSRGVYGITGAGCEGLDEWESAQAAAAPSSDSAGVARAAEESAGSADRGGDEAL